MCVCVCGSGCLQAYFKETQRLFLASGNRSADPPAAVTKNEKQTHKQLWGSAAATGVPARQCGVHACVPRVFEAAARSSVCHYSQFEMGILPRSGSVTFPSNKWGLFWSLCFSSVAGLPGEIGFLRLCNRYHLNH